jgi:predicted RNase H-like HicB family nuclease
MEYIYPAKFRANDDGSYTITYPDLPGCVSEGKSLANAVYMAQSALRQWVEYLHDRKQAPPKASEIKAISVEENEFVNLVYADIRDEHAVRRTVNLPKWMDDRAVESGLSLSRVLQDALARRLE